MTAQNDPQTALRRQGQYAVIAVVVIGFAVTFIGSLANASLPFNALQAGIAVLLGLVYLFLLLRSDDFFDRVSSPWHHASYFFVLIALVSVINYLLLGPGTWLIPLPVVGAAIERIASRWRWLIYLAILGGMTLPLGIRTGEWGSAINSSFLLIPAIYFVIILTQLRLNEQKARQEAENLSGQLEEAHNQLAAYAVQVEDLATTKERNRLAREIHDNLGHYLTVASIQLEAAQAVINDDPEKAKDGLEKAQKFIREGLESVRESVAALRESPVGSRPLSEAFNILLDETRSAGIVVEFVIKGTHRKLDAKTKLTLFRVMQEGLTNIRKHARASRVDVLLDYGKSNQVHLVIRDNGVGTSMTNSGGFGLIGIRERLQLLNGNLEIETSPGSGFKMDVWVPG